MWRRIIRAAQVAAMTGVLLVAQDNGMRVAHGAEPSVRVAAFGAPEKAKALQIGITGQAKAEVGDIVTCKLTGTPAVDLTKPLLDQLGWLMGDARMFVYVASPGQPLVPLDVEGTIVFSVGGATMRPQVAFGVPAPGEYRLLVDWNFEQHQLIEHLVIAEGKEGPDPPDPPPPTPGKLAAVVVVIESSQQTPKQAKVILAKSWRDYLTKRNLPFRVTDPNALDQTGNVPADLKPAIVAAVATEGPDVCFVSDDKSVACEPFPISEAAMLALLKQYGGE